MTTTQSTQKVTMSPDERAVELLARLNVREKASLMFQTITSLGPIDEPGFFPLSTKSLIEKGITHFNLHGSADSARVMAEHHNALQQVALSVNAKIPITLSSDPRHAFTHNPLASMYAGCFSQWPESLGMAAIRDENRMAEYCDIIRQEYVAVGLRAALHPQVDLATQYLWSRISGGLGEDADLTSRLVTAYVRGLQGDSITSTSVSACVKHFPGGGPQRDGFDCHMPWGAEQDYPGDNFEYHLKPFRAAVDAGVRSVMPSYGKPMGTKFPEVAFGFNKDVITGVLRDDLGFRGIVLSDWCILQDIPNTQDDALVAKAWGVEHLSLDERIIKALDAGVDMFGGDTCIDDLVRLVESGSIPEERIDRSARLILREKFALGLFDQPMVDPEQADSVVGQAKFVQAGRQAQADALTLILNKKGSDDRPVLPLGKGIKVYKENYDSDLSAFAEVVDNPSDAQVIILRIDSPWTPGGRGAMARAFQHRPLEFTTEQHAHIVQLAKHAPVIIDLYCDRPAILGEIVNHASAIICNFGVQPEVLAAVLFGEQSPKGKLPFDLPRDTAAVEARRIDVPFDTKDPVFRFGDGLTYESS